MSRSTSSIALAALALVAGATSAAAQGFQVNEHGSCMMGRGGAGVASPCADGSALFWNPAGIVGPTGWTISAGATLIDARGGFTDDLTGTTVALDNSPIPVPHGFFTYGLNESVAFGLGVFVPYGLGTKWPATFEGRFNGYDNDLQSIYIQPSAAFKPHPMISIGAGFDVVMGKVKLTQRVDLSEFPVPSASVPAGTVLGQAGIPFHTDAANATIEASGTGFGGHLGILIEPHEKFSIGARYLSRVKIDYDGDVVFDSAASLVLPSGNPLSALLGLPAGPLPIAALVASQFQTGGAFADQGGAASITMPDQIQAGIAFRPDPSFLFEVDYYWVHWALFDVLELDFETDATPDKTIIENYKNTHGLRAGFDWATSDKLNLRSGYIFHTGAAPPETVTPLLPEGKRNEVVFGLGYQLTDAIRADVAYQYLRQQNRRGRVREPAGGAAPTVDLNSGVYEFFGHLFGVTLTARF